MTTTLERPPAPVVPSDGGLPARRAVVRWAWRLFRREWRQQLLILALIVVAVAATLIGATVSINTPPPKDLGFGTAQDLATFPGNDPHLASEVASLHRRFGRTQVIENQTATVPGSIATYQVRAVDPHGPFAGPMLSLVAGNFPTGAGQVAVTRGVASDFNLRTGDLWHQGGVTRRVVGLVENPQSLLDQFALVTPGQVKAPNQVNVLFDGDGVAPGSIGPTVSTPQSASGNALNPETISIAGLVLGMLLIVLVSIGGFTVLAQRRLRSFGMLESLGATDKHVGLVVRANGAVVGLVGAVVGALVGLAVWLAYRPRLEQSAHHAIGVWALPWLVVVLAMVLAIVATYFAASRPARSITKVPIVTALSGRPAPPRQIHRSAIPGTAFFVVAFVLLGYAGAGSGASPRTPALLFGIVALIPGMILLAPFCLSAAARLGRRAPIAIRLPLRDLARYRARSGSALAAISLGILIAVIISLVSAARYANVLDYAGPNLAPNQINVYTPNGPYGPTGPGTNAASVVTNAQVAAMGKTAEAIAASVGSHEVVELQSTSASLNHNAPGRNWSGPVFVATPQLLAAFAINASTIQPDADILTMRPGLSGTSDMQLTYGTGAGGQIQVGQGGGERQPAGPESGPCTMESGCLPNPVIQEVSQLPSGTSAPNTVITEHAVHALGLHPLVAGWLIESPTPPSAAQITNARQAAAAAALTIETKNSAPSSSEITDWATVFGIVLALGILAMSVGLLRSETAGDLRVLAATGASGRTRRTLAAVTAGALGLLGAVLGTVAGYIGVIGYIRSNAQNGGIAALSAVPVGNLLLIVVGMPLIAGAVGWLLAGREPPGMARQPMA